MANDWKMKLYWRMPVRLQEIALGIYAGRLNRIYYGKEYEEFKEWLQGWKGWSLSIIDEWTIEKLQKVIETAARRVPYYRKAFSGKEWKKVRSVDDLHILPTLDKQIIRRNEEAFIAEGVNSRSLWMEKTSGTTGTSLKIYWPMFMVPKWYAIYEVMGRYIAGVSQEMPRAMMGGRPIIPGDTNSPPYWRFNRRWNQLYLSSYHVSRKTAGDYINALKSYGSEWLTGYGSTIAALAENGLLEHIEPHPLRSVIVSGDTLMSGMRTSIEKFFACKCFDHYGQAEGVAMAMECEHGNMHIIPFAGVIEILKPDGSPCNPGEEGEIVATGLLNDAMPLIRYRTGDYAAWSIDQECGCGNRNPILSSIEGRVDDYLIASDGRKIGRLSTAMKRSATIHSSQIIQDSPEHAYLLIRPGEGYITSHAISVRDDILERIGKFSFDIIEVSEIPKTPRGKTVLVIRFADRPEMKDTYLKIINNKYS